MEANVAVKGDGHEEDERSVEENETRLSDVSIVCESEERSARRWSKLVGRDDSPMRTSAAESTPIMRGYPLSLMIPYTTTGTREPRKAGSVRRPI